MAATGAGTGRVDLHRGVDEGRPQRRPAQRLRRGLRRLAGGRLTGRRTRACRGWTPTSVRRWAAPQDDPAGLSDDDYLALLTADGADLDARGRAGRRAAPGRGRRRRHLRREPQHQLHQRLLRRLPLLRVRPAQDRRRRLHALAGRGRQAGGGGAGARRHRGLPAGRDLPGPERHGVRRHRARR